MASCRIQPYHHLEAVAASPVGGLVVRRKQRLRVRSLALLLAALVLGSWGCTRVVDVDLKNIPDQLVIEGVVANGKNACFVKVSRSVAFVEDSDFPLIKDAKVMVSDSNWHLIDTLRLGKNKYGDIAYVSQRLRGIRGHVYRLEVQTANKVYTSRCQMPDSVTFRGIGLLSEAGQLDDESVFSVVPRFVDPPVKGNCYQFFQYINGKKDKGINVLSDHIGNGLPNEEPIFTSDIDIHLGDTLAIMMSCIDPAIYQIFYQLKQNADEFGITPGNPESNITGGALGYFSAQYEQVLMAKIETDN